MRITSGAPGQGIGADPLPRLLSRLELTVDTFGTYVKCLWRVTYGLALLNLTANACGWYEGLVLV
jgi:hypothetical protein